MVSPIVASVVGMIPSPIVLTAFLEIASLLLAALLHLSGRALPSVLALAHSFLTLTDILAILGKISATGGAEVPAGMPDAAPPSAAERPSPQTASPKAISSSAETSASEAAPVKSTEASSASSPKAAKTAAKPRH